MSKVDLRLQCGMPCSKLEVSTAQHGTLSGAGYLHQSRLVGLEASGSAHHWARELIKLGHDARMMDPAYVKPYVRRQKNDASDAAAICEAVSRLSMRFVGVRSLENQAALMRHKTREMLVSQRTQLLKGLRGHLTEVGVIAAQGARHARELAELIEACDDTIPVEVCEALAPHRGAIADPRRSDCAA